MRMKDKFLCVMAQYDEATEKKLKKIQRILLDNGFIGKQTPNLPNHITLGTFEVSKEEDYADDLDWTAHTTMLIDSSEVIQRALPLVAEIFKCFRGRIESISLYEFWPTRFILEEKLL